MALVCKLFLQVYSFKLSYNVSTSKYETFTTLLNINQLELLSCLFKVIFYIIWQLLKLQKLLLHYLLTVFPEMVNLLMLFPNTYLKTYVLIIDICMHILLYFKDMQNMYIPQLYDGLFDANLLFNDKFYINNYLPLYLEDMHNLNASIIQSHKSLFLAFFKYYVSLYQCNCSLLLLIWLNYLLISLYLLGYLLLSLNNVQYLDAFIAQLHDGLIVVYMLLYCVTLYLLEHLTLCVKSMKNLNVSILQFLNSLFEANIFLFNTASCLFGLLVYNKNND